MAATIPEVRSLHRPPSPTKPFECWAEYRRQLFHYRRACDNLTQAMGVPFGEIESAILEAKTHGTTPEIAELILRYEQANLDLDRAGAVYDFSKELQARYQSNKQ